MRRCPFDDSISKRKLRDETLGRRWRKILEIVVRVKRSSTMFQRPLVFPSLMIRSRLTTAPSLGSLDFFRKNCRHPIVLFRFFNFSRLIDRYAFFSSRCRRFLQGLRALSVTRFPRLFAQLVRPSVLYSSRWSRSERRNEEGKNRRERVNLC